jgi:hypothetical protein
MRWIIALFLALLSIPLAQVAADAWNGRPGPHLSVIVPHADGGHAVAAARHRHLRLYDPLAPLLPGRAKTS